MCDIFLPYLTFIKEELIRFPLAQTAGGCLPISTSGRWSPHTSQRSDSVDLDKISKFTNGRRKPRLFSRRTFLLHSQISVGVILFVQMIRDSSLEDDVSFEDLVLTTYSAPDITEDRRDEILLRSRPNGKLWGPWPEISPGSSLSRIN